MIDPKLERRRQEQREMYQQPVRPKSQAEAMKDYERAQAQANCPGPSSLMAWAMSQAMQSRPGDLGRLWAMAQAAQQQHPRYWG